jgi:hypothetical protein
MTQRTFTLAEARALLPRLRVLLQTLRSERDTLLALQPQINLARGRAEVDGGSPHGALYLECAFRFTEALEVIESAGVVVKDLGAGLVDFPHEHDGRIVYLCWRRDEDELAHWHEVDDGFAGRQPIGENFEKAH